MEAEAPTAPPSTEKRLEIFRDVRRAVAGLINATPEEVTLQQNITEAITIVDDLARSGLPAGEFPSAALEQEAMTEL